MPTPILATKLYIPPSRPGIVSRPRLLEQLNAGLQAGRSLTLVSASAGFGKTTLLSEWIAACRRPAAWLSLDEGDGAPERFLAYFVAALQTIQPGLGLSILAALQLPQPPAVEALLTTLLNEMAANPGPFLFVLDDYHAVDSEAVDRALAFLADHLPPQVHLVIASREDPPLPLPRLRARGQLTELRAADLRFTPEEAAGFLTRTMGLDLSPDDISALEARTEGWIAGLQMAALSMQGQPDLAGFIRSFTGSHHFVLDYLLEEVLHRQPENIQVFLLRTSLLERMSGGLCEAVIPDIAAPGQQTLEYLERANLFIIPLDNERCWYRYHHLFGDLLRRRLGQSLAPEQMKELQVRASDWCERNGQVFEAFRYAVSAEDVDRADRLTRHREMPLHYRSVAMAVIDWLTSLPVAVLDSRPWLWVNSCTFALMAGQTAGVEDRLQSAENALRRAGRWGAPHELDEQTRDLIGKMACARATLAVTRYDPETMIQQARRALEYLPENDLVFLFTANWALATANLFLGNRAASMKACQESIAIAQKSGDVFSAVLATSNLGELQELDNQLHLAFETYRRVLQIAGEHPHANAGEVHLGLARIHYEWNDLEAAEQHAQQSLSLNRQYDRAIDRFLLSEVFLARLQLARGDVAGAAVRLAEAEQTARRKNFLPRLPEIAAGQVLVLLRQGDPAEAARLVEQYDLPFCKARVLLAQGQPAAALVVLDAYHAQMVTKGWADERLRALVLQALALHSGGEQARALERLAEALALAEPGGFIRLFVDEGAPMAELLSAATARGMNSAHVEKLLAAFKPVGTTVHGPSSPVDELSPRELEILRLVAAGLSNQEIGERLFLALDTVKGHNRRIFDKLQVRRRTEAIVRARELDLL